MHVPRFSAALLKVGPGPGPERSQRLTARLKMLDDKFNEFVRYVLLLLAAEYERHSTSATFDICHTPKHTTT